VSAKEHFFSKATAKVHRVFELTKDFGRNFSKKYHIIYQSSVLQQNSVMTFCPSSDDQMM
jgi:hypothetical protein